ncbi:ABC transporter substrate-binding protein (plasmid) [Haloferacaceae archaeon DSL9]
MSRGLDIQRRQFLKATGGAAAAVTLAGCIGGDDGDGDGDGNQTGDEDYDPDASESNVLNLVNSTMSSLDPIQSTDTASGRVIQQMYEGLTHFPNGETEVENLLATDYDLSDDLLTYTFYLNEDAVFHNGEPVTAQDFVYSWRRLAESPNSERANFIVGDPSFLNVQVEMGDDGVEPETLAVEAVDEYTLEVTIATAAPDTLEIVAYDSFSAVPEGLVGDIEGYDGEIEHNEFSTEGPIGSGPFEFDTWDPDAQARVNRFDDYHGTVANVEGVHWQIIENDEARYTYAMEGSADIFTLPTPQYEPDLIDAETDDLGREIGTYGPLENGETVDYVGVPQLSTYYLAFNASNTPRSVRQAIAYVTNHEELITQIFKERGEEAFTFLPPGVFPGGPEAREEFIQDYPYSANETDRDAARQVLEEDGYTEDDPYELTLTTYESDVFQEAGRLTRDKLSGLGIELQLEQAPFSTLLERGQNGDLQFYSLGWTWSWPDPGYGMFGFEPANTVTANMPEETNGYYLDWGVDGETEASQKAQQAWERVAENPDPDAEDIRNEAYVEMEEAIWEDMVCMPLYHGLTEQFYYQHVDVAPFGAMGEYLQVFNEVSLE